jgi:flagellar basal-body rod modification protein FlgD
MSITLAQTQLSALTSAAQQAAQTAATSSTSAAAATGGTAAQATGASSSSDTSATALSSLSSNYSEFLTLLTAQLQNQDPSSPMDSSQFTTELVQFSGVEQQVQTNTNLTQLLQLSQDQQLTQSSAMVGKQVTLSGSTVPLQSGSAKLSFDTPLSEPVSISVSDRQGRDVKDVQLTSAAGQNTWTWNGADNDGNALPDGPYNVAVVGADATGTTSAVPFTSTGTPTSVQKTSAGLTVSFGSTTLDYDNVQSVLQ